MIECSVLLPVCVFAFVVVTHFYRIAILLILCVGSIVKFTLLLICSVILLFAQYYMCLFRMTGTILATHFVPIDLNVNTTMI